MENSSVEKSDEILTFHLKFVPSSVYAVNQTSA